MPKRTQLGDDAADYVRDLITSGRLAPGEFIRIDRIAEVLEISPTPVREGLLALRGEGFVELVPRRGFAVAPITSQDLTDLFLLQAMVAGEVAARAARNATEDEIARLREIQEKLAAAAEVGDVERIEALNHEFHSRINRRAGSSRLLWFHSMLVKYVPSRFFGSISGWPESSLRDHEAILRAFEANDPAGARVAMEAHIRHAGALLAANAESRLEPDGLEGKSTKSARYDDADARLDDLSSASGAMP